MNYYNEFDPNAAAWLENLILDGLIPDGHVDRRSITDVKSSDLKGYTSCHFFAGIGGWPLALRLAGWPDDLPVWTGSPPCQPFSAAGKQRGKDDSRHLAPTWIRLVDESEPPILFGEQVEKAIGHRWIDDLFDELEFLDYACAASVLPAGAVGAPHQRMRLFFAAYRLADADRFRTHWRQVAGGTDAQIAAAARYWTEITQSWQSGGTAANALSGLADDNRQRPDGRGQPEVRAVETLQREAAIRADEIGTAPGLRPADVLADGAGERREGQRLQQVWNDPHPEIAGDGKAAQLADLHSQRHQGQRADAYPEGRKGQDIPADRFCHGTGTEGLSFAHHLAWGDSDWLLGVDGNFRPVRPGSQPLAYGLSGLMGQGKPALAKLAGRNRNTRLKGYGNAIVPGIAAEHIVGFLRAIGDVEDDRL